MSSLYISSRYFLIIWNYDIADSDTWFLSGGVDLLSLVSHCNITSIEEGIFIASDFGASALMSIAVNLPGYKAGYQFLIKETSRFNSDDDILKYAYNYKFK